MEVLFVGIIGLYVMVCIVWMYCLVVLKICMLCRVLYAGTVCWYYWLVCYGVHCMEVLFGGIIGLYVMVCIAWRYCLVVL